ncbi:hypothetical protein HU200_041027 [Digitaria exilis]|uniref:Uncharacterized protein n=1 Tax=Digitaria exilis TaxID=1010633 RepID=A0A835BJB6_9POAL|nr:hypothetical protein HU200_041027 [Digitaria exilis]
MAPSLKIASLVIATTIFLLATLQAQGWAPEDYDPMSDIVPMTGPVEEVMVAVAGGLGTLAGADLCTDCLCCARKNPANCLRYKCCGKSKLNSNGTCTIVQDCGCRCQSTAA